MWIDCLRIRFLWLSLSENFHKYDIFGYGGFTLTIFSNQYKIPPFFSLFRHLKIKNYKKYFHPKAWSLSWTKIKIVDYRFVDILNWIIQMLVILTDLIIVNWLFHWSNDGADGQLFLLHRYDWCHEHCPWPCYPPPPPHWDFCLSPPCFLQLPQASPWHHPLQSGSQSFFSFFYQNESNKGVTYH